MEKRLELSCDQKCHIEEILANLKCPGCFQAKTQPSEKQIEEKTGLPYASAGVRC